MTIQDEQLIFDYLGRLADAAQGRLAPLDRVQLVEEVRGRIEEERRRGGSVRQILAELASVECLVAGAVEAAGRDHDSAIEGASLDDDTTAFSDGSHAEPESAHVAALILAHLGPRDEETIETVLSQVDTRKLLSMTVGFLLQLIENACPEVNVLNELTQWQLEQGGGVL
jgi:hypothetical protein